MKACVYASPGKVELRNIPEEPIERGKIRIKVAYCAICATDAHVVKRGLWDAPLGIVLGHEVSGIVVEMGPDAGGSGLKIGDRVIGSPLRNCGLCEQCRRGRPQYCNAYSDMVFGGMAEYKVYDQKNLYKIPDYLALRDASLIEPLTCVMRAMDLSNIQQGDAVCLSGCGGIGLLMLQAIKAKGASRITVIEPVAEKHELARELGAEFVIDPKTESVAERAFEITSGLGYDVVIEASGAPVAAPVCIDIAGKCGTVVYFAVYPTDFEMPVNLYDLYSKELRIQTVYTHPLIYPRAVDFASEINLDRVIGIEFPLEECVKAFEAFDTKKYPKVVLRCSEDELL
ncbi:butanediol dehydrogenase [Clostridia bacterium]|nr:butanediol dehydrogenase [Clostridia bacterium]